MSRLLNSKGIRITSPFGPRRDPLTGESASHSGIDIVPNPAMSNPQVLCHTTGMVSVSSYSATWGNYVDIRVSKEILMRYAHLANRLVRTGHTVYQGDRLGTMGATGRVTGAHLHFGLNIGNKWVNPEEYLEKDVIDVTETDVKRIIEQEYEKRLKLAPSSSAESRAAREWAQKEGIFKGDETGALNWQGFPTREQLAIILYRLENR